jgi:sugar phosphate isomerase/epimerase
MDIGVSTLVDLDLPIEGLLKLIAAAGFSHVSLGHDVEHAGYHLPSRRRELKERLGQLELKLNYIHAPLDRYYDLTSLDRQVRRASVEVMKICIEACSDIGGNGVVLHVMNGPLGAGESITHRIDAGLESLQELIHHGQARGVGISVENLPVSMECGVVSLAVLRAATALQMGVCLDTCHACMHVPSGLPLVEEFAARVRHTHLSDTVGDHDSHLIPGDGGVDFQAIAGILGRAGFRGVVDMECSLWMLRYRNKRGQLQPGDPSPSDIPWITTAQFLERAAAAARRIGAWIEEARVGVPAGPGQRPA